MPPKTEWDREYNMVQSFNQIGSSEPRLKSHNRNVSFFVLLDVKNTPWRVSIDAPLTGLTLNYLAYISYLLSKQSQPRNFLLTHIIFDIVIMWDFIVCVNKMQLEKGINLQFNLNWKTNPLWWWIPSKKNMFDATVDWTLQSVFVTSLWRNLTKLY